MASAANDVADVSGERLSAREEVFSFLATQGLRGQGWRYRVEEGEAFEVILRLVKETRPDLVIVGTHGRSGIVKVLLGSVAEAVLGSLEVDIRAVPPAR